MSDTDTDTDPGESAETPTDLIAIVLEEHGLRSDIAREFAGKIAGRLRDALRASSEPGAQVVIASPAEGEFGWFRVAPYEGGSKRK